HRSTELTGPLPQRVVIVDQAYRHPFDSLDVQDALGRLTPGAGHIADDHHAQTRPRNGFGDTQVFEAHRKASIPQQRGFFNRASMNSVMRISVQSERARQLTTGPWSHYDFSSIRSHFS